MQLHLDLFQIYTKIIDPKPLNFNVSQYTLF